MSPRSACKTFLILGCLWVSACSSKSSGVGPPVPPPGDSTITVSIDRSEKHQTIDGFGFFGAQTVWWESNSAKLFSQAWADQVIKDLGITIWRNEYYPPATTSQGQDADWQKQLPVVTGLSQTARNAGVPLKFIFTVWSPPADLKCALDNDNHPLSGTPHTPGTKKGGTLDPAKYAAFGNWLADGLQLYKDAGVDVYAISPQNEPLFKQDFNSCYYEPTHGYGNMLASSIPVVKARFPDVKIFGSENMLEMEGGNDRQYFYSKAVAETPAALNNLDIWAVHGYQEGITPTSGAKLSTLWQTLRSEISTPTQRPVWMTETSGYSDSWAATGNQAGAIDLAADIQSALVYGNASAWLWWQGSDDNINEYSLMAGSKKGKKYFVSKHFYRFIRPGSTMVKVVNSARSPLFVSAFENTAMNSFTIVMINSSAKTLNVSLSGQDLPADFDYYFTTAATADNCVKGSTRMSRDSIKIPPSSVVTLVNGNVFE